MRKLRSLMLHAAALFLASSLALHAQQYPTKPIRIIVGFAAGGPTEVAARLVGQKLTDKWGQPVLVEMRPGAGGNLAAEAVARSAPDGYTLLLPAFSHAVNPALYPKLLFDTEKDFAPITVVAVGANLLAVHPSVPARSLREFIALAKARPGELTYGSAGVATASHLAGELLNSMAGIKLTHVPYKGAAPASTDLIGGHISASFPSISLALPLSQTGKIRVLGIASLKRSDAMPDIPTISEAGLNGFEVLSWNGLMAPAATPVETVLRLNQEVGRGLHDPDAIERLKAIGVEPMRTTPAEFGAFIRNELVKWGKVIQIAGVKAAD